MITLFRRFAKSWVAVILIGLLVISFVVWGTSDVLLGSNANTVIKAGERELTTTDYARAFNRRKEELEQENRQPIPVETAVQYGLDRQVLDLLANGEALAELVRRMGVRVSDKQVLAEIRKIPAFFDQISGKFDQTLYLQRLAEQKLTDTQFEDELRTNISVNHVMAALATGLDTPRVYAAVDAAYILEGRDLSFFLVDPGSVKPPAPPTDAQLQAFIKENADQFTLPEFRQLTLVRFSAKQAEPSVTIDQAELQRRFDFRKDSLSRPELRTVAQIAVKNAADGARVQQQLLKGADPAAAARVVGAEPLIYADKPRTAIVDRKVAEAAFALKEGQVSAPIQGELGMSVIKVLKVTPGQSASLAALRPEMEAELRADTALKQVYALTEVYEDAHTAGATLTEAAQKAGVPIVALPPMTAEGQLRNRQQLSLPPKLLKVAFELPAGGESGIEELAKGEYYAVRVEKVIPPTLLPLAEIKPQVAQIYLLRELAKRMEARAGELAARVRKGESLAAVAASVGAKVHDAPGISQFNAKNYQGLGGEFLGKVFGAEKGEVFVAKSPQFGFAVARLEAIKPAPTPQLAQVIEPRRRVLTKPLFDDLEHAAQVYARAKTKTRADLEKARQAIGVDPKQLPGAAKTDAAGESEK